MSLTNEEIREFTLMALDQPPAWPAERYIKLDYISSNGNQFFNTGIYVRPTYTVCVVCALNARPTEWQTIFGTRDTNAALLGSSRFTVRFHNTKDELEYQRSNEPGIPGQTDGYQKYIVSPAKRMFLNTFHEVKIENRKAVLDGTVIHTFDASSSNPLFNEYPLFIFALNSAGVVADGIHGNFKSAYILNETGRRLANYYPVERTSDGAVGAYDTVSHQFIGNSGTGNFVPHYL